MMRRLTDEERELYAIEYAGTFNMVNICSLIEGVVVWRSPKLCNDSYERLYHEAGEILMIIQSLRDRKCYKIVVPSFDLR